MLPRSRGAAAAALLFLAAGACAQQLPRAVSERMATEGLPRTALAFVVRRADDGREVAAFQADVPMAPASTLKLLTSAVALDRLGPAWRGSTEMLVAGERRGAALHGDLVLRGRADADFDWIALRRMLQRLRLQGVRDIRGDLLLDRSYFQPERTDVGVPPFDDAPEFRYNVIPDALMVGMNLVDLELVSDARRLRVASTPSIDGVAFEARATLVDAACDDWEDLWKTPATRKGRAGREEIVIDGPFPRDCAASTAIDMVDRDRYIEGLVRALWRELGGSWQGRVRAARTPEGAKSVARHRSRPLGELLRDIDKRSDNPTARTIFLVLGAEAADGEGDTAARAARVVRGWLAAHRIDDRGLELENGSGLSRRERVTPALLSGVILAAGAARWAPEFVSSLPIAATDGGLQKRLGDSVAAGRARLKTGTLRDASAIAGWVPAADGTSYVVVAIVNDTRAVKQVARPMLDALVDWVARGMPRE